VPPGGGASGRRRLEVITAGHRGDEAGARGALGDGDPVVWAAALGALERMGTLRARDVAAALAEGPVAVRRKAVTVAVSARGPGSRSDLTTALHLALDDDDALVVVGACTALGERRDRSAVPSLGHVAREHADMRCREAAVAALGAIGDPEGLGFVLGALEDKPTVRRRATVALAAFEGEEVEAALRRSLADRDWQVREVAEILLGEPPVA
jgi:HEAT repeat protein